MPSCDVPNHSNTSKPRKWHIDSWHHFAKCGCVWFYHGISSFSVLPASDEGNQNLEEAELSFFSSFFYFLKH